MRITDISSIDASFKLNLPKFNHESITVKIANKIQQKYGDEIPPIPPNRDEIFSKAQAIFTGNSDDKLSAKELKFLCSYCLDQGSDGLSIESLANVVEAQGSKRHYAAMMASYVMNFSSKNEKCRHVASLLDNNRPNLSRTWLKRLENINLLDVDNVEQQLAAKVLLEGNEKQAFNKIGLTGGFQASNLATSILITIAKMISSQIAKGNYDNVDNFIRLITDGNLIKREFGPAALIGLLLPFTKKTPPSYRRNELKELFLTSFSDPRVSSHLWPEIKPEFGGVSSRDECLSIMKKWLNFDSIELFFKIIAEHAPDAQFKPRRQLWQSYFDQEYVSDAWVILGSAASRTAKQMKKSDENAVGLRWSKLTGAQPDQSVLLMKIGDLVVAEWSHSGKFRAWDGDSSSKPEFYKPEYTGYGLRRNSNKIMTQSGGLSDGIIHNGNWVPRAETYISQQTGIRLSRKIR